MQGLMNKAPEEQQPQAQGGSGQEDYDMAVGQMLKWVASDEGYGATVQALQSDPQEGMAMLIGRLLQMSNQSAYMAGKQLSPNVIFQAGMEMAKAIASVGLKEGLLDKANEAQMAESAFLDGLAKFAQESQAEALTDQSKQQFMQLIDGVEKMMNQRGAA